MENKLKGIIAEKTTRKDSDIAEIVKWCSIHIKGFNIYNHIARVCATISTVSESTKWEIIKNCISHPDFKTELIKESDTGLTLMMAVSSLIFNEGMNSPSIMAVVKQLLEKCDNINYVDDDGYACLDYLIDNKWSDGHQLKIFEKDDIIKLYIKNGAKCEKYANLIYIKNVARIMELEKLLSL